MAHPRHEAARAALEDQGAQRGAHKEAFSPAPSSVEMDPGEAYEPAVDPGTQPRGQGAQGFDPGISDRTTEELTEARGKLVITMANAEAGPQADAFEKLLGRIDREISMRGSAEISDIEPEAEAAGPDIPEPAEVPDTGGEEQEEEEEKLRALPGIGE